MTTSRTRTLLAAMVLAGGLAATGSASAAPGLPLAAAPHAEIAPVQYWGDHEGRGHRRHHDGPRYGHGHRHDGWGHRRHGWDHHRGWGHRHHHHHHHRGHGRYDY